MASTATSGLRLSMRAFAASTRYNKVAISYAGIGVGMEMGSKRGEGLGLNAPTMKDTPKRKRIREK